MSLPAEYYINDNGGSPMGSGKSLLKRYDYFKHIHKSNGLKNLVKFHNWYLDCTGLYLSNIGFFNRAMSVLLRPISYIRFMLYCFRYRKEL
jgi:hypothetical protein